jgi:hypothetical protein
MLKSLPYVLDWLVIKGPFLDSFIFPQNQIKMEHYSFHTFFIDNTESNNALVVTSNQFVLQYLQFLNNVVNQFVITSPWFKPQSIYITEKGFYTQPEQAPLLNSLYKWALLLAFLTHQFNLISWSLQILQLYSSSSTSEIVRLNNIISFFESLLYNVARHKIHCDPRLLFSALRMLDDIFPILDSIARTGNIQDIRAWTLLLEYYRLCEFSNSFIAIQRILEDDNSLVLYPHNSQ